MRFRESSLGTGACVQVLCVQKMRRLAFALLNPPSHSIIATLTVDVVGLSIVDDVSRVLPEVYCKEDCCNFRWDFGVGDELTKS